MADTIAISTGILSRVGISHWASLLMFMLKTLYTLSNPLNG